MDCNHFSKVFYSEAELICVSATLTIDSGQDKAIYLVTKLLPITSTLQSQKNGAFHAMLYKCRCFLRIKIDPLASLDAAERSIVVS